MSFVSDLLQYNLCPVEALQQLYEPFLTTMVHHRPLVGVGKSHSRGIL